MFNYIILIGASASGKTSIADYLCDTYGFRRVRAYTTRPPRDITDEEYNFIDDVYADAIKNEIVGNRVYYTAANSWRYFFSDFDFAENVNSVAIMPPDVYSEIKDIIPNAFAVYLDIDEGERMRRLLIRGDDYNEILRRMESDKRDFKYISEHYKDICDLRSRGMYVKKGVLKMRTPAQEADRILTYLRGFNRGEIDYDENPIERGNINVK
nr:MAG TPA: Guanylate kinase [Caudoviricetes sp.]